MPQRLPSDQTLEKVIFRDLENNLHEPAFELYAGSSAYFFRLPEEAQEVDDQYSLNLPGGWKSSATFEWTHVMPPSHRMPEQGWKIHLSTIPGEDRALLQVAAEVFFQMSVPFKYLTTPDRLAARNSKLTPREHAGKFVTAYPSASNLEQTLNELEQVLAGFSGPYILSDRRWLDAPVFLRYGAFRPAYVQGEISEVGAVRNPAGQLVPDIRGVTFSPPAWAEVPEFLKEWAASDSPDAAELPFEITSAIKFSTAGGTYRGEMTTGREPVRVVVKEARAHSSYDYRRKSAEDRLLNAAACLMAVNDVSGVPRVHWSGRVWENTFVAESEMPGISLRTWVVANFPAYRPSAAAATYYLSTVHHITLQLDRIVTQLHDRGWAHNDIHMDNVLLSEDLEVSLVDFEYAVPTGSEPYEQVVAASGFRSKGVRTPGEIDWHGVRQIVAFMLVPLIKQAELVADYSQQTRAFAREEFPSDPEVVGALDRVLLDLAHLDARTGDEKAATRPGGKIDSWTVRPLLEPPSDPLEFVQGCWKGYEDLSKHWTGKRAFPVHVYGLAGDTSGIAYGEAGVVAAMLAPGGPGEVERLVGPVNQLIERLNDLALGSRHGSLFSGGMGDIWALEALGAHENVDRVVSSSLDSWLVNPGMRIYDGLPGVLLGLLRLSELGAISNSDLTRATDALKQVEKDYWDDPSAFAPVGKHRVNTGNHPSNQNSGLLYGHLGMAWLFAEGARILQDKSFIDAANMALSNELAGYHYDQGSGTLQLSETTRAIPYLSTGSAGFGVVLPLLGASQVDASIADVVPLLSAATHPPLAVFPGLLAGFAGLALGDAGLQAFMGNRSTPVGPLLRQLGVHAIESGTGLVFAGDSGLRITADFASGAAGVAFAVQQIVAGQFDILPPLKPRGASQPLSRLPIDGKEVIRDADEDHGAPNARGRATEQLAG